jgi:hypothetical protein
MGFTNLTALIYLVSIPALIYIYYFSRKKKRVEISSIIPWRLLRESVITSSLFRTDLLFYLQLALLLLLVGAACRPYWKWGERGAGRDIVAVIDRSASMQAVDGDTSRWEHAREALLKLVGSLRPGDGFTLIAAGDEVEALALNDTDHARLAALVKGLKVTDTPGDMGEAVDYALSIIEGTVSGESDEERGRELYILSDRNMKSVGIERREPSLHYERFGDPLANQAITSLFLYREPFEAGKGDWAFVGIENFSDRDFNGVIALEAGNETVAEKEVRLDPHAADTFVFSGLPAGLIRFKLAPEDALAVDNVAYAFVQSAKKQRGVLFTRDPICRRQFAQLASVVPRFSMEVRSPADYASTDLARYDFAVFHRCEPERLPPINMLIIEPSPRSRLVPVLAEGVEGMNFIDWNELHPVGKNLRGLHRVRIARGKVIGCPSWAEPVVISATGQGDVPLVICGTHEGRRIVVTSFDTSDLDIQKAASLPALILFLNIMDWITPDNVPLIKTGEPYETLVRAGGDAKDDVVVLAPSGERLPAAVSEGGVAVFRETAYTGRYLIEGAGERRTFVANLLSRTESDLLETGAPDTAGTIAPGRLGILADPLIDRSALVLAVVMFIMLLEWLLYGMIVRGWMAKRRVKEGSE